MKKILLSMLCFSLLLISCVDILGDSGDFNEEEVVVIANRASGSVSYINANTNELIATQDLPANAEPMYVVYVAKTDKIYVGDRSNSQVHVINPDTRTVEESITVGNGVFHMWADGKGKRLWVNNDIDNTISVVNLASGKVQKTISLDGKPHDVFLTKDGRMGYVSILIPDGPDKVYAFNANNLKQVATQEVGEDPHLFHFLQNDRLYVPCQNTNQVLTLNGETLEVLEDTPLDGAHGIFGTSDENQLYITGINVAQLYSLRASDSQQDAEAVTTPVAVPHNVVTNFNGSKLFVTHSGGTADQVSIYEIVDSMPVEQTVVVVGNNPFGIAYYKRN